MMIDLVPPGYKRGAPGNNAHVAGTLSSRILEALDANGPIEILCGNPDYKGDETLTIKVTAPAGVMNFTAVHFAMSKYGEHHWQED